MDRLLRFDTITSATIDGLVAEVDAYTRAYKVIDRLKRTELDELQHLATVRSVGSSTRIEGSQLDDEAVADLIDNMEIRQLQTRDEQEVAGYYRVLQIIQTQYDDLTLSEALLKGLHNELMRESVKAQFHRGDYKRLTNQVVATDPSGHQEIVFKTTSVLATPHAMREAVAWYNHHIERGEHHPLIVIGTFIYEFLTIHPIQDGNGRLSRLLTNLLLLRAGYEFVLYASLERVIEEEKRAYYKALMKAQRHRGAPAEEIGAWMYFLLKAITRLIARLEEDGVTLVEEPRALYLNARQSSVLQFVSTEGELSVKELDTLLPEVSRNTVKYDLRRLTEAGYLERRGRGRGTVYVRARR